MENIPSLAGLLKQVCQVTHFSNSRGWIETPDGRFFKPEPNKVRFIKEMDKPFIYTRKINKGVLSAFIKVFKKFM
ncbi:phage filamentation protein Fil family protein [Raoultella planticola]|uniref:phage filamentation protein Fil family protein n=1 Tax=Raoultella planticola TaxID=575 RepID=UPI0036D74042